jgi:hypothetical protein
MDGTEESCWLRQIWCPIEDLSVNRSLLVTIGEQITTGSKQATRRITAATPTVYSDFVFLAVTLITLTVIRHDIFPP